MNTTTEIEKKILVIADLFFASKLKGEVQVNGYGYTAAPGIKSALDRAREYKPAAIVIDLAKKNLDFMTLIESLQSDPETKDIPTIGFCGHMDIQKMNQAKEGGYTAVVTNGQISGDFSGILQKVLTS